MVARAFQAWSLSDLHPGTFLLYASDSGPGTLAANLQTLSEAQLPGLRLSWAPARGHKFTVTELSRIKAHIQSVRVQPLLPECQWTLYSRIFS